ncbi:C-type lectin domain family 11 member A-like [Aplysia californica]|uniref:C-type lectin domain family 11 member A-like n=1 Tax=Aplysia californica TaxID=6500 RepID=A0ABM1A3Z7_APLCA|nr:C-type lectin domain family 11 member A-like [Aplysia californica]
MVFMDQDKAFDLWTYPTSQVVGKYRCEANGLDEEGHPLTAVAETVVEKKEAQIGMILDEMKEMKTKMTEMKTQMTEMDTKFNDLRTRVDNSKAAFTEATTSYGNSHYILSKPTFRNVAEGNRLCRLYGGYLAEINDRQEFDYLADYLSHITSTAEGVMLGATDEGQEGTWRFLTSGGNMSTLVWLPHEPNGGTRENCLCIWKATKLMVDCTCLHTPVLLAHFLCEIPV